MQFLPGSGLFIFAEQGTDLPVIPGMLGRILLVEVIPNDITLMYPGLVKRAQI